MARHLDAAQREALKENKSHDCELDLEDETNVEEESEQKTRKVPHTENTEARHAARCQSLLKNW